MIRSAVLLAAVLSTATFALQQPADTASDQQPHWIWIEEATGDQEVVLVKTFELEAVPASARLTGTCDNQMVVTLNGDRVGVHSTWERVVSRDVAGSLRAGENTIEVRCINEGGPAGLVLRLDLGDGRHVVSDGSWRAALAQRARRGRFDDATVLGPVGAEDLPWSGRITVEAFDAGGGEMTAADPREPQLARPAERITLPEGFVAELLHRVPNEVQGSWVSLANGPDGTLFASDQGGKGLFRIEPAAIGDAAAVTTVERLPVDVSGAQGMTWAFDSLYANVNGQGVWRIRDTDGDGEFDDAANIIPLGNGGEHEPHAVMPTLDGPGCTSSPATTRCPRSSTDPARRRTGTRTAPPAAVGRSWPRPRPRGAGRVDRPLRSRRLEHRDRQQRMPQPVRHRHGRGGDLHLRRGHGVGPRLALVPADARVSRDERLRVRLAERHG